ncbi:hypothetical protein [Scytonema sp. NUACC26]|uniref:hypothetical protein n=1 Tax=Scytonema sp. NUACC26 TaxID=3140176 RepID=UPI0034DC6368
MSDGYECVDENRYEVPLLVFLYDGRANDGHHERVRGHAKNFRGPVHFHLLLVKGFVVQPEFVLALCED